MTGLVVAAAIAVVTLVSPAPPAPIDRDWPPSSTLRPVPVAPVPAPTPEPPAPYRAVWDAVLDRIRGCESGTGPTHPGRYGITNDHGRSTSSGAYQFVDGTWLAYRGESTAPRAYLASPAEQDAAAWRLFVAEGTRPWNASRACWS